MSILDKKTLVEEIAKRLGEYIPAAQITRISNSISETLESFNVEAIEAARGADISDELIKLFLDAKTSEGKSDKTIERYGYILERLHKNIGALNHMTVFKLRNYMSSEMERGIAASTVDGYRSVACSFYSWLHKEELIEKDPTANLAPIKVPKVVRKPYQETDLFKLNDHAHSKRDKAIIAFLKATGCRISEMCGVNREDIDFQASRLIVTGKGDKERVALFGEECALRLREYLAERTDEESALFINRYGERIQPGGVRKILKDIAKSAGVEGVHPHRFRRTLATDLITHGMPVTEVAHIMGHSKLDTTMTYVYTDQKTVEHDYRRYA